LPPLRFGHALLASLVVEVAIPTGHCIRRFQSVMLSFGSLSARGDSEWRPGVPFD
jgi:hypothetical protein